jgi:hypothetical protein
MPIDSQPFHLGVKSHHGIRFPFITSGASLKEVVIVHKIGNKQTTIHIKRAVYIAIRLAHHLVFTRRLASWSLKMAVMRAAPSIG